MSVKEINHPLVKHKIGLMRATGYEYPQLPPVGC